mgnify:CR=1 FL=1
MSANTALELEDVVFRYQEKGKRNILDHTSLSIPAGTLTVLMGGSGCGKSTLLRIISGLAEYEDGIVERNGHKVEGPGPQRQSQEGLSTIRRFFYWMNRSERWMP